MVNELRLNVLSHIFERRYMTKEDTDVLFAARLLKTFEVGKVANVVARIFTNLYLIPSFDKLFAYLFKGKTSSSAISFALIANNRLVDWLVTSFIWTAKV